MDIQKWIAEQCVECIAPVSDQPNIAVGSKWRVVLDLGENGVWLAPMVGEVDGLCVHAARDHFAVDAANMAPQRAAPPPIEVSIGSNELGWRIWLRRPTDAEPFISLSPVDARVLGSQLIKNANVIGADNQGV